MTDSDENGPQNAGQRMRERALRAVPEAARRPDLSSPDLIEGTSREVAFIDEDGSICINHFSQKDFVSGRGWEQFSPDEPEYAEYCAKYGLEKPGDSKCIISRFIDGEWVVVEEKQEPNPPDSGVADQY